MKTERDVKLLAVAMLESAKDCQDEGTKASLLHVAQALYWVVDLE